MEVVGCALRRNLFYAASRKARFYAETIPAKTTDIALPVLVLNKQVDYGFWLCFGDEKCTVLDSV
jgi:hypothetical protein